MKARPIGVTKSMLVYLNNLRESSKTNMFFAAPYVKKQFGVSDKLANNERHQNEK